MSRTRYGKSGPHHGWRPSAGIPAHAKAGETLNSFGRPEQKTINRMMMTKRTKGMRVTLPTIKALKDDTP